MLTIDMSEVPGYRRAWWRSGCGWGRCCSTSSCGGDTPRCIVRLVHRQGPVATLCLRFPAPGPGLVEVDGVTLTGNEVRFPFSGQHEVVAYY